MYTIQGLDIPDIQLVIVYGIPDTVAQFSQVYTSCTHSYFVLIYM